jgi:CBS-domain-containing membrane protein
VVSLTVAALAWSLSGNSWIGMTAWLAVAAVVACFADRRGHRNLVAFLGGAAVTLVALSAVPLAVARYYVG